MYCHCLVSAHQITQEHLPNKCESLCFSSLFHFTLRCDSWPSMQQPPQPDHPGHTHFLSLREGFEACSLSPDCHMNQQPSSHRSHHHKKHSEVALSFPLLSPQSPAEDHENSVWNSHTKSKLLQSAKQLVCLSGATSSHKPLQVKSPSCTSLVEWGMIILKKT